MADTSKAQKLASARKKFKELKKEKKKNTVSKPAENVESSSSREQTPVDNNFQQQSPVSEAQIPQNVQLPNYFNDINVDNSFQQQPAAFFDSFAQNPQNTSSNSFFGQSPETVSGYFINGTTNLKDVNCFQKEDLLETDKVDNKSTEVLDLPFVATAPKLEESSTLSDFHMFDSVKFNHATPPQPQFSSVESLKQLSEEMAELIKPNSDFMHSTLESDLELRNQELAALLNQEKIKNEQLNATLHEYQMKVTQLESEVRDRTLNTDNKVQQEVSKLREELQSHVQTVGILVAEKTELSANLSQFQLAAKQKTSECEELQGRLKTSRSRVADLEREINMLKNEKLQHEDADNKYLKELERVQAEYHSLKQEKEELMQDLLEVREKLKNSSENNLAFQQQIAELQSHLSLANIKIQQLTTGTLDQSSDEIERLTQEKFALEKHISELNQTVKSLSKEREESSLQYQQYAQQLNAQLSNLAGRLEQFQKENESLSIQEQNRIKHISELEKQLQNLQNDQVNFAMQKNPVDGAKKADLDASLELVQNLREENSELQEENLKFVQENEGLVKVLEEREDAIKNLESVIEELKGNQPDNAKLLAVMESDKVAAARAVAQNSELKQQMESMQEVFMKLNNDKVELTEKLTSEHRNNKDLMEKLQKTELHLQTLADAIEIKDKELSHLRESSLELNKQVLQSEQLTDRLRHYEAQNHSSGSLQTELQDAKQTISRLTEEITRLNSINNSIERSKAENQTNGEETEETQTEHLRKQLQSLQIRNRELEAQLQNGNDHNHNDNNNSLDKESAMKRLEAKFMKTMEDIANLTEEKQRLEHLVLQLQSETETIGEYVALYQHQRSILKQKALEKDQQLSQLANDREHIKSKLEKLNDLVRKLVVEKGAVPSELLEHHADLVQNGHQDLCEEHARIHSEINKITQQNINAGDSGDGEVVNDFNSVKSETAEQIISLLAEIKTSNLVQPTENFHHCPWCSGQLITV